MYERYFDHISLVYVIYSVLHWRVANQITEESWRAKSLLVCCGVCIQLVEYNMTSGPRIHGSNYLLG